MNELQIFNNEKYGEIRTIVDGDKVLFCASDVAKALGYARPADAITTHCRGSVKRRLTDNLGREQETKFIPEGDVYRLIIKSKLPTAEKFENWVFDEVLPTIRKYGGYVAKPMNQLDVLAESIKIMQEQQRKLDEHSSRLDKVENNVQQIKELEQINSGNWRLHFGTVTRKLAQVYPCLDAENPYQAIRHEFYERLEAEARCNLDIRLKNKKIRALKAGLSMNKIKEFNKLDIIQEDMRLTNSAIAVLKKMSIQYGIN